MPEGEPAVRYEDILRDSKKRVEASNKLAAHALNLQMLDIGHAARPTVADAADSAPPRAARCFAGPNEPHLVMLGTGAAALRKLQSCSGILVQLACGVPWGQVREGRALVLLDCGEGCLGRLMTIARLYAPADVALGSSGGCVGAGSRCGAWHGLLLRLAAMFVSHMHADHHSGLFLARNRPGQADFAQPFLCPFLRDSSHTSFLACLLPSFLAYPFLSLCIWPSLVLV